MQTISKPLKILIFALILSNLVLIACIVYLYLDNTQNFNAERININTTISEPGY